MAEQRERVSNGTLHYTKNTKDMELQITSSSSTSIPHFVHLSKRIVKETTEQISTKEIPISKQTKTYVGKSVQR